MLLINTKRLLIFSILGITLLSPIKESFAFEGNKVEESDIKTWNQYKYPLADKLLLREGGELASSSGCGYFALATIGRKITEKDIMPLDLVKKARYNSWQNTDWGHFNWDFVERMELGLKVATQKEIGSFYKRGSHLFYGYTTLKNQEEKIKEIIKEGYYVIACMEAPLGGHYIAIDSITDEGRLRITDSGYKGTYFDEFYKNYPIKYLIILEAEDNNKNSLRTKSVYNDEEGRSYNEKIDRLFKNEEEVKKIASLEEQREKREKVGRIILEKLVKKLRIE